MKIGVIGAGAIGMLFSCYLSEHHEVTLYCRTSEQADIINKNGITIDTKKFRMRADTSNHLTNNMIYIVCVKQYHLNDIFIDLQKIDVNTPLLFLQNGIGHLKYIDRLSQKNIYLGVIEHGASKENIQTIHHNGKGVTRIALYRGDYDLFKRCQVELNRNTFPFLVENQYEKMLVGKLIVNAVINPLTAVLKVKNGELIANQHYKEILFFLFNEVASILDLQEKEDMFEHVVSICKNTSVNESSMLRDVKNGKETEIDGIVGALLQKSDESGKKRPPLFNFLYHAIKGTED